jgi:microcystin-dependent protein
MSTTFPTTIDSKVTSLSTDYLSTTPHSDLHNNLEDRTIALETKVGIDSSADTDSQDYKISAVQSDIDAYPEAAQVVTLTGEQTISDKTLTTPTIASFVNATHTHTSSATGGTLSLFSSGMIMPYAGSSAPTGWLICDGSAVSRTTYSGLFAICGTTYGVGDTTTTFNIPNLKGKTPVGYNSAEGEFDALGETGGAKTVTLTTTSMPAHTHTVDPASATTGSSGLTLTVGSNECLEYESSGSHLTIVRPDGYGSDGNVSLGAGSGSHTHSIDIPSTTSSSAGSDGSHNNLQPYLTLNYIIKT